VYCAVTFRYFIVCDPNGSGFVILLNPERNKKKLEVAGSLFLKTGNVCRPNRKTVNVMYLRWC
jgi:hypothetical protein